MLNLNKHTKTKYKPKPTCPYHCAQLLYTIQHITVLITFPHHRQKITIVQMLSIGRVGGHNNDICNRFLQVHECCYLDLTKNLVFYISGYIYYHQCTAQVKYTAASLRGLLFWSYLMVTGCVPPKQTLRWHSIALTHSTGKAKTAIHAILVLIQNWPELQDCRSDMI